MNIENPSHKPKVETKSKQERLKQLYGHCFEFSKIEAGDLIPVGGNIIRQDTTINVEADFNNFKDFFDETQEAGAKYDVSKIKDWLSQQGIEIDEKIIASLLAFTIKFQEKYPIDENRLEIRRELYNDDEKQLKLSDIFNAHSPACAEIAALAQKHLQNEGISSSYFSGDVLWKKEHEFSSEHSFIVIRQDDQVYIYDPTSPTNTNLGFFPSIYTVDADFDKEMNNRRKKFVTAKNILSKAEAYYGVNNGTNIIVERDII